MSVLVDSSVWINHFRGNLTASTQWLRRVLADNSAVLVGADLVLLEVVRGCRSDREAATMAARLQRLEMVELGGAEAALRAAHLYRKLRAAGTTVAKTVDLLIASWCIHEGVTLLHDDADFRAFERYGLRSI